MTGEPLLLQQTYAYRIFEYPDYQLSYIPILKNAHTWATHFFDANLNKRNSTFVANDNLWKNNNHSINDSTIFIVILRDPVQRWIAGTTQYLLTSKENLVLNEIELSLLKDGIVFDNHTKMQYTHLINIDLNRCIFFM